jgi:hypothetical protein
MAVLSVPSLQQSSFTGHGLHWADKVPRCKQDFIRVNLGFCTPASDTRRLWAGDNFKNWNGSKVRDAFLLGSHRSFRDSLSQRCGPKFANVLSEGSGDGGGGNAGNGSGGGGSERPPNGEDAGGDDHASNFDLEAALLCCGTAVAVVLGLWTSRNKECRALLRVAGKVLGRDSQHDGSTENTSGDQVDSHDAEHLVVERLQGVVQSAALFLSSLNNGELFSGTSPSDPSTSGRGPEEATFSFPALASLSLPFLSFMSKKGASAKEEIPPKVDEVWEVQGDSWTRLVPGGPEENEWILSGHFRGRPAEKSDEESASASTSGEGEAPRKGRSFEKGARRAMDRIVAQLRSTLLPEGFPHSVTEDYPEYSAWRVGQIIASQVRPSDITTCACGGTRILCKPDQCACRKLPGNLSSIFSPVRPPSLSGPVVLWLFIMGHHRFCVPTMLFHVRCSHPQASRLTPQLIGISSSPAFGWKMGA